MGAGHVELAERVVCLVYRECVIVFCRTGYLGDYVQVRTVVDNESGVFAGERTAYIGIGFHAEVGKAKFDDVEA